MKLFKNQRWGLYTQVKLRKWGIPFAYETLKNLDTSEGNCDVHGIFVRPVEFMFVFFNPEN